MKNEHIEFDELYRLAEIEVQEEVYSEEEKKNVRPFSPNVLARAKPT